MSLIRLSILRHKGYIKRVPLAVFEDYKSNQFHKVLIFFRSSGNFPDHLESFQAMQKLSRPSRNIPKSSENVFVFQCKQFKVGLGHLVLGRKSHPVETNKIILDECSTVVEIDHVRNLIDCLERKNG